MNWVIQVVVIVIDGRRVHIFLLDLWYFAVWFQCPIQFQVQAYHQLLMRESLEIWLIKEKFSRGNFNFNSWSSQQRKKTFNLSFSSLKYQGRIKCFELSSSVFIIFVFPSLWAWELFFVSFFKTFLENKCLLFV